MDEINRFDQVDKDLKKSTNEYEGLKKSTIEVEIVDITTLELDAIVNAANERLSKGNGVCGAIFDRAGWSPLALACKEIGGCETGNAVITPGFLLPAKYIIHAVGPVWCGGTYNEPELLYSAYKQSLKVAKENACHSIGFPLISSGIYKYPKREAWEVAVRACLDFIKDNPDYEIKIVFAVIDKFTKLLGEQALADKQ